MTHPKMNAPPTAARAAWPLVSLWAALLFGLAATTAAGPAAVMDLGGPLGRAIYGLVFLPLVLGGGAAFGPLLLGVPVPEPSLLKLGLVSALLSPPLVVLVWSLFAFGWGLAPKDAWTATFAALGALALLGVRGRVGRAPLGRAAALACLMALGAGILVLAVTLSGPGLGLRLTMPSSIASLGLAMGIQDGAPLVNPWFSGGALELRPFVATLLAAASGPQGASPAFVSGILSAWCAALVVLAAYLSSAALFREGAPERAASRDLLGALAAGSLATGWAVSGARVDLWLSLAYGFGFVACALHVVRRGARPWPGLAACALAILGLIHPWAALLLAVPYLAVALASGRLQALPLGLAALLPGLIQGRLFGGFGLDQTTNGRAGEWIDPTGTRYLLPSGLAESFALPEALAVGVAGAGLVGLFIHVQRTRGALDRAAAWRGSSFVGLLGALLASCSLWLPGLPGIELLPLSMLGFVLLGAMCGGALEVAGRGVLGAAMGLGLGLLAAAVPFLELRAFLGHQGAPLAFKETLRSVELRESRSLELGLDEAFRFLGDSEHARNPHAVLFREPGLGLVSEFLEPISLGPILSGIPLFGARALPPGTRQTRLGSAPRGDGRSALGDHWTGRQELLDALFERENKWQPRYDRVLRGALEKGLSLVFVVTEADRRATTDRGSGPRGVDMPIRRLGAEEIFSGGETSVYLIAPPNASR